MAFCFVLASCTHSVAVAAIGLGRLVLEERAILAAPSPLFVLHDVLWLWMVLRGMSDVLD